MTRSGGRAQWFTDAETRIIQDYRRELEAINSPLAANPVAWAQCEIQATRILRDCAVSLASGEVSTDCALIAEVTVLGTERVRQGIHATHSVRAGMALTEQTLLVVEEYVGKNPGTDGFGFGALIRALQRGIGLRVQAGILGHDTYLLTQVRELNDQGRRQLAREIHDKIGNELSLATRQLELYEIAMGGAGADPASLLDRTKDTLVTAISHTRELITELRRPILVGTLEIALRAFTQSFGGATPVVQIWVRGADDWLPTVMHDETFLMIRECLRNAYAHAGAANIVVNIDITPDEVHAEIVDDGRGFDLAETERAGTTNGLSGLRERIDLLGGMLAIDSAVGRGTRASIWLPIPSVGAAK